MRFKSADEMKEFSMVCRKSSCLAHELIRYHLLKSATGKTDLEEAQNIYINTVFSLVTDFVSQVDAPYMDGLRLEKSEFENHYQISFLIFLKLLAIDGFLCKETEYSEEVYSIRIPQDLSIGFNF